jgi:hypothetical protein
MDRRLQRLQEAIESATQGMSDQNLTRRPAEGKWSPAEVLEHLSLTYAGTVRSLERSLKAGRPLGGSPTLKQRINNILMLNFGYFPRGRESPEGAKPKGMPGEKILAEFNSRIADMDEAIQKCETTFGKRTLVVDHPVLGPFTMQQWRKFHWVHGKHHLKQIKQMRKTGSTASR